MARGRSKAKEDGQSESSATIAEERLRKQELARHAYSRKQTREQRYAHINCIKISNQWRKIRRLTKLEELKCSVEILAQNHERDVDRKDAIIQILDRDLDDCEDQYQLALRQHSEALEKLHLLQSSAMHQLRQQYEARCREMKIRHARETSEIETGHERRVDEIESLMHAMQNEFGEAEGEERQDFEAQREEIKNKNSEEYNVLKIQLEGNVEGLERQFDDAHKAYVNGTEHRERAFQQLSKNDAAAAQVIEMRMAKLQGLQDSLVHWRQKISGTLSNWEERNKALRREKETMSKQYKSLKQSMEGFRSTQAQHLKHLSIHSAKAVEVIIDKLQTAESILKLWKMSQSLETEKEQILPFGTSLAETPAEGSVQDPRDKEEDDSIDQQEKAVKYDAGMFKTSAYNEARASYTSTAMNGEEHEVESSKCLEKFFKRYNSACMSAAAIKEEKSRLEKENSKLQVILRRYLNGLSVNADVLDDPANSLFIINNKIQAKLKNSQQRASV